MFWSITATTLLVLLLLSVNLLVSLLADGGRIDELLTADDAVRFQNLTGVQLAGVKPSNTAEAESAEPGVITVHVFYDEHGLLPLVWHARNEWWGPFVSFLYRNVSWLQSNTLALICLLVTGLVLVVCRDFCLHMVRSLLQQSAIEAVTATRKNLHRQVLRLGPEDLDGTAYETAIQLFSHDVETIRDRLYQTLVIVIRYPIELVGLSIVLFSINWSLTLQWVAPLTLGLILLDGLRKTGLKRQRLVEDKTLDEEKQLLAILKNARLTRGLGIEQIEHEHFQKRLSRYHSQLLSLASAKERMSYLPTKTVLISAALLAFLMFLVFENVLDSRKVNSESGLTLADAVTFFAAILLTVVAVRFLKEIPVLRRELNLAADKVHRYLSQIPAVSQAIGAKFLQPMSKTLRFENVKYQTPGGRKVLDGIDFQLESDKSYAVVSIDPLEAKAVALMLPRFIEPREGRVMIDGEDITWVTLESLRAETVFVAADEPPFEGTVFENIRAGQQDLTLQQVTEAAKITHAHNFILKLFNGYETVLNGESDSLDAGQQFRLSLARAIVRDPALLVIEEPSAPMDEDTKALLADAYDRLCRGRTVIFLPARMSTVKRTDQVIVLHEGKVAAIGPHSKLNTLSPVYRHWEYIRFNEFRKDV